jgi:hypothetical protein
VSGSIVGLQRKVDVLWPLSSSFPARSTPSSHRSGAGESIPSGAHALATFSTVKLFDLGYDHLRGIDTSGVTLQILSCTAGCRGASDELAAAVMLAPVQICKPITYVTWRAYDHVVRDDLLHYYSV